MGMYTAFHFASELKKDTPKEVIDILNFMNNTGDMPETLPAHEFFDCSRWSALFVMDSFYFDATTHCSFKFNDISGAYYLTVTSNLKDYDNEIKKFINWITPYLNKDDGDMLGYSRYEETEEPEIIYFNKK